ncbi:MAG: AAA domain-containing protein, partial [Methanobrevibacter wolinii]
MDGNSYLYENFIYLGIKLTNCAVDKIKEIITKEENLQYIRLIYSDRKDEVLNIIISNDKVYDFYIKDITKVADSNQKIRLIMASDTDNLNNQRFIRKRSNNILCIDGVNIDKQHFLITNIYLDPIKFGNKDVNYYFQRIKLCTQESIKNICIRYDILSKITNVNNQKNINNIATNSDNAIKNSRIYVNESKENNMSTEVLKKIDEWDSYLKIIEDKARKSQLDIQYKGYKFNNNFTKCTMTFKPFTAEEIEKLQNFRNDRVILYNDNKIEGMDKRVEDVIGSIDKINTDNYSIVIALNDEIQELLSNNKMTIPKNGYLKISKMGDLAQAMNLRRGLNLLKSGKSLNKQLPMILFDIKNLDSKIEDVTIHLDKNNLLLNTLNTNQIKAVEGVLNSKDIFLIQGPPGTGKTTVIAEICYQNAIRGLKTLIASQSNLAVDNALGRIIDNPKIRALRTGNLSRVESEGEKYTEANVIKTWVDTTINTCKSNYEKKSLLLKKIDMYIRYIKNYKSNINEINLLETEMNKANTNILNLEKILNQIKVVIYEISSINLYEDTNTQLRNITIINERILTLKYLLEHKSIKIYDNDFIINNLNSLYNNNLNYYNKVKDIVILEEEIRNLKSIKKNQLKNFEQFLIYNSNNINIKYKFENYKNINKKINDIEHRIDLLRKYAHIVNNRLEELISIKIKYSISSKKVKYNTNNENNKISEDYFKKIIDNYLVDTKSIIEKRPLFMNLQRSLGLSSICKWEVNLLKYINNGYIILHLIKEKIQNYSNLISNFKSQIIYMKEECEEIIYNEIKEVERNINDARQSIEKEFKDYENSKNFIDYIIKITTSGLEENIDIISDRKQVELNKL